MSKLDDIMNKPSSGASSEPSTSISIIEESPTTELIIEANEVIEDKEELTDEQIANLPTVKYVFDRDTIVDALVLGGSIEDHETLDLLVRNHMPHKFITNISNPPSNAFFKRVRKGSGRADVGSWFIA